MRIAYATKGLVYLHVGGLAVLAALGQGGQVAGTEGAIRAIGEHPFGRELLVMTAVGLLLYALWRASQGVLGRPDDEGAKGAVKRAGRIGSGLLHLGIAFAAAKLAMGAGAGRDEKQAYLAQVIANPAGRAAVSVAGVALVAWGLWQVVRGARRKLTYDLREADLHGTKKTVVVATGSIGMAARGIVFGVIGVGIARAAFAHDAREGKDVGGAMREIAGQSHGRILLAIVAAGLAAYGVSLIVAAAVARLGARR